MEIELPDIPENSLSSSEPSIVPHGAAVSEVPKTSGKSHLHTRTTSSENPHVRHSSGATVSNRSNIVRKPSRKKGLSTKTATAHSSPSLPLTRIPVPPHRYTPLRNQWMELLPPLIEHMHLQVRVNTMKRCVEVRQAPTCTDPTALQKGTDYIKAFLLGFELQDAIALLRLDDLFVESFETHDVKRLQGAHLSRCIARIAGKDGKTKHAIENATRTRIVLADQKIHILGNYESIKLARDSVCSLILGSPPGKVYNHLRTVAKRLQQRF
ncbi:putative pre-rRna-processing protein PNO1 [Cardiosporidium cionae]|uniref:Pre-rRna-processing protein PNO1 n=1 Tax=Cardiosporidium cionae TaxID=476202 RepID=A0ABQ7JBW5_9APIC|nr:putative pre-rRna-processing protein PNO1 [Cardiosporidium cionae]|eukprot:KAF8821507.1 putative pre-rRna-processing protein PNO1 [Cardiosporidium cionae]